MCVRGRTMIFLSYLVAAVHLTRAAPSNLADFNHQNLTLKTSDSEVERSLERFLNLYYDTYINKPDLAKAQDEEKREPEDDIYETMQGDQPVAENNINHSPRPFVMNSTNIANLNDYFKSNFTEQYIEAARNRQHVNNLEERRRRLNLNERAKESYLNFLKVNILEHLGRTNASIQRPDDARLSSINMSEIIPTFLNSSNLLNDDQITEKIRSFYPSCEVPVNTDQDLWKDDDIMNLFFNFEYVSNDRNTNIATATLRLYRLPENGTQFNAKPGDCDNFNSTEEDKLLRVSIYWYTKSLKKRRVKRRLSDSRVIPENSKWVELSVKPATKAWTKGRNLGLGVLVEDQEGNMLRADRYFKGASCMQRPNQSRPSSLTPPGKQTNLTEWIAYFEEIQRQPYIVTYTCYPQ